MKSKAKFAVLNLTLALSSAVLAQSAHAGEDSYSNTNCKELQITTRESEDSTSVAVRLSLSRKGRLEVGSPLEVWSVDQDGAPRPVKGLKVTLSKVVEVDRWSEVKRSGGGTLTQEIRILGIKVLLRADEGIAYRESGLDVVLVNEEVQHTVCTEVTSTWREP